MRGINKLFILVLLPILCLVNCKSTNGKELSSSSREKMLEGVWEVKLIEYLRNDEVITENYPFDKFNLCNPDMDRDIDNDSQEESYTEFLYFEINEDRIRIHTKLHLEDPGESMDEELSKLLPTQITYNTKFDSSYTMSGNNIYIDNFSYFLPEQINFHIDQNQLTYTNQWDSNWKTVLVKVKSKVISRSEDIKTKNILNNYSKYPLNSDMFWQYDKPENHNVDDSKIQELLGEMNDMNMDSDAFHSFILIRNGKILYENYAFEYNPITIHAIHSVTKSFTSFLVGKAVEEGYIGDISDNVVSYFPEIEITDIGEQKTEVTIEHLLTMRSGMAWDDNSYWNMFSTQNACEYVLNKPMEQKPGTFWSYNNGSSHLLAGLVQKTTGKPVYQYANEKLFEPLGIKDYFWIMDQNGVNLGCNGLYMRPRDMAKFGYLYLNGGKWQGEQLINKDWVSTSSKSHTPTSWGWYGAYGYQWWIPEYGEAFSAKGYAGQEIIIYPDKNAVVVFTSNLPSIQTNSIIHKLNKDYVLPALK